jgi:capsid protein
MPEGWDINQLKSEQPAAEYSSFKREIVSEEARCIDMPYNVAAADSSKHNFASGKLDHLPWFKSLDIAHQLVSDDAATPTFERWFEEANRIDGYLPAPPEEFDEDCPPHTWFYDGQGDIDPREAGAKETGLRAGFETLTRLYAKQGRDAEQELRAEAKLLGLEYEEFVEKLVKSRFAEVEALEQAKELSDESEATEESRAAA